MLTPRFAQGDLDAGQSRSLEPAPRDRPHARPGALRRTRRDLPATSARLTPEDPYPQWPGEPDTFIVPMFLLFDYRSGPRTCRRGRRRLGARERRRLRRRAACSIRSRGRRGSAWCQARCAATEARLDALPDRRAHGARQSLAASLRPRAAAAHSALLDLVRHDAPPKTGRAAIRARVVVSGHLHLRTTLWRHGVRYDEVSLGYPRDWRAGARTRVVPARDPAGHERPHAPRDSSPPRDPFLRACR